jgi:hypothetical protein
MFCLHRQGSISSRISGEIRTRSPAPSTSPDECRGRIPRAPCQPDECFPTPAILVTYMRVRTTSFMLAPAFCSALSMFFSVCTACAYTSPTPTIFPSGPVAVVPTHVHTNQSSPHESNPRRVPTRCRSKCSGAANSDDHADDPCNPPVELILQSESRRSSSRLAAVFAECQQIQRNPPQTHCAHSPVLKDQVHNAPATPRF